MEEALLRILLSKHASSHAGPAPIDLQEDKIPMFTDAQITAMVLAKVEGAGNMLDRLGQYPICHYLCLSYRHGLPSQAGDKALQRYTKLALRWILYSVSVGGEHKSQSAKVLLELAEAYQGCHQIQARAIDNIFGKLTGRDLGVRGQLFEIVDIVKQSTMDRVTLQLHPHCLDASADMGQQMLHIQSAYLSLCGDSLGLRGVQTAKADRMKPRLSPLQVAKFVEEYTRAFPVRDVVQAFVRDINQVGDNMQRTIGREVFFKWCQEASQQHGFDAQQVLYQEEHAELYAACGGSPPRGSEADNLQAPWLHNDIAVEVLLLCFGDR